MVAAAPRQLRRRLVSVLWALAALGLLAYLLYRIGPATLLDAARRLGVVGWLAFVALGLLENFFDALSLRFALRTRLGTGRVMAINSAGAIVNVAIPWEAGELLKGALLSRSTSVQDATSATLVWNLAGKSSRPLVALVAVGAAVVLGVAEVPWSMVGVVALACLLAYAPYLALRYAMRRGPAVFTMGLIGRVWRSSPRRERWVRFAGQLDTELRAFFVDRRDAWLRLRLAQVASRVVSWACWMLLLWLLGLPYSAGLCSLLFAAVSVASYVAMLVPARLGVAEGAGYLVFSLLGLGGEAGLITALLQRAKMLLTNGVLALGSLRAAGRRA
jgi:hypothetical protein